MTTLRPVLNHPAVQISPHKLSIFARTELIFCCFQISRANLLEARLATGDETTPETGPTPDLDIKAETAIISDDDLRGLRDDHDTATVIAIAKTIAHGAEATAAVEVGAPDEADRTPETKVEK